MVGSQSVKRRRTELWRNVLYLYFVYHSEGRYREVNNAIEKFCILRSSSNCFWAKIMWPLVMCYNSCGDFFRKWSSFSLCSTFNCVVKERRTDLSCLLWRVWFIFLFKKFYIKFPWFHWGWPICLGLILSLQHVISLYLERADNLFNSRSVIYCLCQEEPSKN